MRHSRTKPSKPNFFRIIVVASLFFLGILCYQYVTLVGSGPAMLRRANPVEGKDFVERAQPLLNQTIGRELELRDIIKLSDLSKVPTESPSLKMSIEKNGDRNSLSKVPTESPSLKVSIEKNGDRNSRNLGDRTILLIIASNRPYYLQRTLDHVISFHPGSGVPIVVSEDGSSLQNLEVISNAKTRFLEKHEDGKFTHIHNPNYNVWYENGYFKLSAHFKWALTEVFENMGEIERVIILEEDIEIAPDFFEFFSSIKTMVDEDVSLLAASAWNDNGFKQLVKDREQLYRSDFFPGLGWMMPKRIWNELKPKWPRAYWDDWLREPAQRQGRHIIRPEVCRTLHFGARGVSNSQFSEFLNDIKLNDEFVPFTTMDLSYLSLDRWNEVYVARVNAAPLIRQIEFPPDCNEVRIQYNSLDSNTPQSFVNLAKWVGCMDNIKAKVPRTAYMGIVSVWKNDIKVHLVPSPELWSKMQ